MGAGARLRSDSALAALFAADGPLGRIAAERLGIAARPVRAVLFDKSPTTNWALGWHQDRTIVVRERREVLGFGPWTVKRAMIHVSPPIALLARMLTLRVHLDNVPDDNGPLLIAPGTHRMGRIAESDIADVVRTSGFAACTARAGDAWIYSTPILHASEASVRPMARRVFQVDYAAEDLPGELEWLGL